MGKHDLQMLAIKSQMNSSGLPIDCPWEQLEEWAIKQGVPEEQLGDFREEVLTYVHSGSFL